MCGLVIALKKRAVNTSNGMLSDFSSGESPVADASTSNGSPLEQWDRSVNFFLALGVATRGRRQRGGQQAQLWDLNAIDATTAELLLAKPYCTATPAVWSASDASHAASSSISAVDTTSPNSLRPSHVFRRYGSMRAPFR